MFGFSWAEIALIMAVALIAIGPKDLPIAIRTVTGMMKKARGMAAEFQSHVDEMVREANLSDVKDEFNKMRRFDFKSAAEKTIDPDGTLRETHALMTTGPSFSSPAAAAASYAAPVAEVEEQKPDAPDFIPPAAATAKLAPAFIPPGTKRWGF